MIVPLLTIENFARQIFFAIGIDIYFGRRNSAAHNPRNLQTRAYVKRRHCVFQELWRHTHIQQRAQKHVAADSGKTVEVGYAHKVKG
jgi:flagellar basal body rod protein FlgG